MIKCHQNVFFSGKFNATIVYQTKPNFDHHFSQVSGDGASLYPEAPTPAAGTCVV